MRYFIIKVVCPCPYKINNNSNQSNLRCFKSSSSSQNLRNAGLLSFIKTTGRSSSRMEQNNSYEFKNTYPDFDQQTGNGILDITTKELDKQLLSKIERAARQFTDKVNAEGERTKDYSVYTGNAGIALLNFLISQRFNDSKALSKAEDLLHRAPQKIKHITFLQDAGPIALSAVVSHYLGKTAESKKSVSRLVSILDEATASNPDTADECLYGRAGYLYSLLFVRKHLGSQSIDPSAIKQVVRAMLESGRDHSAATRNRAPLAYEWYGDNYLGAAHGVAGILYMLFKSGVLSSEDKTQLVKPTLDDLLSQRLPSGNFPSSQGSRDGRLVQWCHGAPGFAELLATAYKEFGEERYLTMAEDCGDVVWQRGLTTKGYSLCHGVSGNTYTFLQLYQLTGDLKHLYRAGCFADWCLSLPKHEQMKPDRPFSLFEGLGGVAYLLTDIQDPAKAGFPAYTLSL